MQGEFNECAALAYRAIRSVLGFENWYNRILGVCIGWNMIKILPAFLMMSSVAMASEPTEPTPPIAAPVIPVYGQKLNPSPCELLKKITVKKDKNGREIITTETSADCRYDSNMVKKQKEFENKIIALVDDLNNKYDHLNENQEHQKAKVVTIEAKVFPKPVDRKPFVKEDHMILNFMIGMLKGIKEW
tara:strand:+ start:282 stop:845 length:564 start_codon:yes stop_codon:yes gene_type:complete